MRGAPLALAAALAACASAPVGPADPKPPTRAAAAGANPSGEDIERILGQSGLAYVTVEPGRRWMVAFAGRHTPRLVLHVVHGDEFTVVLGKLFTVRPGAGEGFFRSLARRNYELDQLKLSVDANDAVYASFEVPTRILDRQELLENIFGLAGAIDAVLPELVRDAGAVLPPPDDDGGPPATPLPPTDAKIIEALRRAVRSPVLAAR